MRFDFNEANILKQTLYRPDDTKEVLIYRLVALAKTTDDDILKSSVLSLIQKVESLTPLQIKNIQSDIENKRLVATANFEYGTEKKPPALG